MARKPSTSSVATVFTAVAATAVAALSGLRAKVMTSAPPALRRWRRDSSGLCAKLRRVVIVCFSRHRQGCALDGAQDPHVRTAAAKVGRECGAYLLIGWIARDPQERGGLHDHAVDAVATLHGLLGDERLL